MTKILAFKREKFVFLLPKEKSIIQDEYVAWIGTGCLKVTLRMILMINTCRKTRFRFIDIFNSNGTLNKNGLKYENLDRFIARKIVKDLEKQISMQQNLKHKLNIERIMQLLNQTF